MTRTAAPRHARRTPAWLVAFAALALLTPAAAFAQADDAAVIRPYLADDTFLVARVDTDRVDLKPVEEMVLKSMEAAGMDAQTRAMVQPEIQKSMQQARTWLDEMTKAGGRRMYVVMGVADANEMNDGPPMVVVPTGAGADRQKIMSLLNTGQPDQPAAQAAPEQPDPFGGGAPKAVELGQAVVFARPAQVERVKKQMAAGAAPAGGRAEGLAEAFKAAGDDVTLRVALVPGEAARKWVEQNLPALPEQVGGGETRVLSRGVKWAALGVKQKPQASGAITIQATDAGTAKAIADKLTKGREFVQKELQQQAGQPGGPPALSAAWVKQFSEVQPRVQGDRVTIQIAPDMLMVPLFGARAAEVQAQPAPGAQPGQAQPQQDKGGL